MNHRYSVYDDGHPVASLIADSPEDAILQACAKTTGHDPKNCIAPVDAGAKAVPKTDPPSWRTLGSWSDFDWSSFGP